MSLIKLPAAILASLLVAFGLWWLADRPVAVTAEWRQPLASVSFAPFHHGQSPIKGIYANPQQVEADLAALVGKTRAIRTYTSREGLEVLPDLAAKYGLKVTMGAWLGRDGSVNDAELRALIQAANAHPDVIDRVIVGNEVLLRRDLPPEELIAAIRRVKAAIKQPVSYADVWAFYLKYPEVGRELDYITVHILPFWEDEPMGIDATESHTVQIVEQMRQMFPGKPILIGEAGWPSIGRDRGPAVVDQIHQAAFVRQMANIADRHKVDYNIVEDFDQAWKSQLEGTVGAAWGIMDEYRRAKFPLTGPVQRVADWPRRAGCALLLGAVVTLVFGRSLSGAGGVLAYALAAQCLAWLLVTSAFHAWAVTFRGWQDWWLILRVGLPVLLFAAAASRIRDWLSQPSIALQGAPAAYFGKVPILSRDPWRGQVWLLISAFYAVAWTLMLLYDGRYRDIPEFDFAVPVGATLLMLAIRLAVALRHQGHWRNALAFDGLWPGRRTRLTALLAWLLPIAAVLALVSESRALMVGADFIEAHPTFAERLPYMLLALVWNREMDLWAAMLLLWSLPFILARRWPGAAIAD